MLRFAFIAFVLFFAQPAFAAPDGGSEAELRGVIERLIGGQRAAFEKTGGTFETNGAIMVEPAGKYYAVTLPDITLVHPNKSRTALGLIALNASPAGAKKWNITMALPTPIITKSAAGAVESELSFGRQSFTGLWDESFQNFTSLKTIYENIRINLPQETAERPFSSATIKKMGYGFDLSNMTQKKTNLTFRLGLEGMAAQGLDAANARLFPSDATVNVDLKDLPVDKLGDIQKNLLTPNQTGSFDWISNVLAQSGSEATINSIMLKNAQSSMNVTGKIKPSATAPLKHTGNLVMDVARIDQLLLALNDAATKLPPSEQGKIQNTRIALTMMAALGENVSGAGPTGTKRYNVELREDGKIMMNGTDFTPLLAPATKTTGKTKAR